MKMSKFSIEPVGKLGFAISKDIAAVIKDAEKLQTIFGAHSVAELNAFHVLANSWRFSVAAVGQMKAGKSSFLNAIIHSPNLLPSDVNPWTTVVTKMRFGHPEEQVSGGRFNFFSEHDWNKIINRSEAAAEHLDDLIVGFDQNVLKQQFEDMRGRAKDKLGNLYPILLGNAHNYDTISKSVLERYVAAGVDSDGNKAGVHARAGYYADITKYAEIFFPKKIFEVPTVVIDTPGVNDPYLVRDEFTCQVLDEADVYLMFTSVHQALTPFDLKFINILTRQYNKRVILVVNRVDELDNFAKNAKVVLEDVEKRLVKAGFQDNVQAVVAGSAAWAQAARTQGKVDADLPMDEMRKLVKSLYSVDVKDERQCLEVASGLHAIEYALENSLNATNGMMHVQQLKAQLASALRVSKRLVEAEIRENMELIDETDGNEMHAANLELLNKRLRTARMEHNKFETSSKDVLAEIDASFTAIVAETKRDLSTALRGVVKAECEALATTIERDKKSADIAIDLSAVCDNLFNLAQDFYVSKLTRLSNDHQILKGSVTNLVEHILSEVDEIPLQTQSSKASFTPMMPKINENLKVSLTDRNRVLFWKKNKLSHDELVSRLQQVVSRETAGASSVMQRFIINGLVTRHNVFQQACASAVSSANFVFQRNSETVSNAIERANGKNGNSSQIVLDVKKRIAELEKTSQNIAQIAVKYS